ncbi:G-alpha-domain-containing protein [Athelia psychrophila]|uniref:G-alpha-domain-containing protein n=1 Tax=Athelia psychrophila TaxID=1759441 RepID=A0A166IJC8_9AGAM|nr:G-alpha-domain-containing protein [Fibularhizoctonia sp. CBS 109695]KZP19888.1 G-alpha-domain-containing protein [Fibularhizoctonia sp. CBS 109695]
MHKIGMDCETPQNRTNCHRIIKYRTTMPNAPLKMPSFAALNTYLPAPHQPFENTSYLVLRRRPPCDNIGPAGVGEGFVFDPEIVSMIVQLWADLTMAKVMDHSSEFYLMDSAQYFFENAMRIGEPGYVPTESDVLRARQESTEITETRFNMGRLSIHMFDFGGQRLQRQKWIHCFHGVTSVIFCTALSEYDQVLFEHKKTNRMVESFELFESIIDVFKAKLPRVPLEKYFPEYTAGPDINKAAQYICWCFIQKNHKRLAIYPHLMQATDTTNVQLVFAAVKETILRNALKGSGIL